MSGTCHAHLGALGRGWEIVSNYMRTSDNHKQHHGAMEMHDNIAYLLHTRWTSKQKCTARGITTIAKQQTRCYPIPGRTWRRGCGRACGWQSGWRSMTPRGRRSRRLPGASPSPLFNDPSISPRQKCSFFISMAGYKVCYDQISTKNNPILAGIFDHSDQVVPDFPPPRYWLLFSIFFVSELLFCWQFFFLWNRVNKGTLPIALK